MPDKKKNTKKEATKKKQDEAVLKKSEHVEPKPVAPIKYSYSVNFGASNHKTTHANPPKKEEAAQEEKKSEQKEAFVKEEEAVKEAETLDAKDIEHIKYSDKDGHKHKQEEEKTPPPSATAPPCCGAGPCASGPCATKESKTKFSFKEFWTKIKSISFSDVVTAINTTFTIKNAQACAAAFLHWVDSCVSFVTISHEQGRNEPMQRARMPILFGMWVCIFTFVIGGAWSGFAPLNSATHAIGIVVTTSKKQAIQYRDGGILKALYVKEGDHVKAGQILAQMDDAVISSTVSNLRIQKASYEKELEVAQELLKSTATLHEQNYASKHDLLKTESSVAAHQFQLSQVSSQLTDAEEKLNRTSIKSNINGIVTQVDAHTIGGTVGSGSTLMTITPTEEELVIEAYISQKDIESVHVGLKAKIGIDAFRHRTVGYFDGIVTYVSSDVLDIPQGGRSPESIMLSMPMQQAQQAYYKAKISVDKEDLKKISKYKDYELAPGMKADVTIVTGERTLLQYLLTPITATFMHAFSEK